MIKVVGLVVAIFFFGIATAPTAFSAPPPKPILECPNSNVHVWDLDQCDSFDLTKKGHGGGRCSGILCGIPGLGGLLGGLL